MLLLLLLLIIAFTVGVILLLHRLQLKNSKESADRSAPLAAVDLDFSSGTNRGAETIPAPDTLNITDSVHPTSESSEESEATPTIPSAAARLDQPSHAVTQGTPTQITIHNPDGTPTISPHPAKLDQPSHAVTQGTPTQTQTAPPAKFGATYGTPTVPDPAQSPHGTPTQATIFPAHPEHPSPQTTRELAIDSWLSQAKILREEAKYEAALALCRENYPRIQAFQQSGVILRQQIREQLEQNKPVSVELQEIYRIAVLADLYRNSNPIKPSNPAQVLQALQSHDFDYQSIGTRQLRLLTKSDIRHLEQLWGRPAAHRHAEQVLGTRWNELCL